MPRSIFQCFVRGGHGILGEEGHLALILRRSESGSTFASRVGNSHQAGAIPLATILRLSSILTELERRLGSVVPHIEGRGPSRRRRHSDRQEGATMFGGCLFSTQSAPWLSTNRDPPLTNTQRRDCAQTSYYYPSHGMVLMTG